MADLRVRRRTPAHLAVPAPAAVQAAVDDRRARHARVPAHGRLRPHVPRAAEGPLLRAEREDRPGRLAQEPGPLRGVLADDRQGRRLPVLHAPRRLLAGPGRAPTASWSPGTPRPAASAGATRPSRSSRRRCCTATGSSSARGTTASTRSTPRPGKRIWRFQADNQVNTSAAWWKGRIFIGDDSGTLYALSAKTGKLLWSSGAGTEFWYATPTVAYGRVYIGNTDGTMYVYGAKTGNLLWAKPLGTYIYGAAAVYRRKVFVGTYDGKFYALDAATGRRALADRRGRRGARRADGDARPRVLRRVLELRRAGIPVRRARSRRHLRRTRARRHARLALPRRQVREPGDIRRRSRLRDRPRARVRVREARARRS